MSDMSKGRKAGPYTTCVLVCLEDHISERFRRDSVIWPRVQRAARRGGSGHQASLYIHAT